tara:strand:- start:2476 stop:2805 length:330 start_codon:yes stop_codon:yes gene_type:complete
MDKKVKEFGKATAAQIKEWKDAHGDVRLMQQMDEDGNVHNTYFRIPKIDDKSYAAKAGGDDGLKIATALYNQCRLGGSDEVSENDQLKQGVMQKIVQLAKPIDGDVKKL